MNLLTATMVDENAPIGTQSWYSIIPLISLNLPQGTVLDPTTTCKDFLQQIMQLEPTLRAKILNTEVSVVSEQLEDAKRSNHKTLLVAVAFVLVFAAMLILAGYVAMTSHTGGTTDASTVEKFLNFIKDIFSMLIEAQQ